MRGGERGRKYNERVEEARRQAFFKKKIKYAKELDLKNKYDII